MFGDEPKLARQTSCYVVSGKFVVSVRQVLKQPGATTRSTVTGLSKTPVLLNLETSDDTGVQRHAFRLSR